MPMDLTHPDAFEERKSGGRGDDEPNGRYDRIVPETFIAEDSWFVIKMLDIQNSKAVKVCFRSTGSNVVVPLPVRTV
jgi:hypothetical protein